jgi:hypothetical protein
VLAVPGAGRSARRSAGRPGVRGHGRQVTTDDDGGSEAGQTVPPSPGPDGDRRRWDTDDRGIGVGDARAWRPTIEALAEVAATDGWVAEEPELHLLPHLEAATAAGPLALRRAESDADGTFVVDLEWAGETEANRRDIRAAMFVLIGSIAESMTVIHELPTEAGRQIDVLTGLVGPDSPFATHGHTVRFRLTVPPRDRDRS